MGKDKIPANETKVSELYSNVNYIDNNVSAYVAKEIATINAVLARSEIADGSSYRFHLFSQKVLEGTHIGKVKVTYLIEKHLKDGKKINVWMNQTVCFNNAKAIDETTQIQRRRFEIERQVGYLDLLVKFGDSVKKTYG